jgi:hypothetical protein
MEYGMEVLHHQIMMVATVFAPSFLGADHDSENIMDYGQLQQALTPFAPAYGNKVDCFV